MDPLIRGRDWLLGCCGAAVAWLAGCTSEPGARGNMSEQASVEQCDGLDNDCDGEIDQGDALCGENEVCDRGECVEACGEVVFNCSANEVCSADGLCVDAACADMTCAAGERCIDGTLLDPASATQIQGKAADGSTAQSFDVYRIALDAGPGFLGAHELLGSAPTGLQVVGFGRFTSYQYPGGLNLNLISDPPKPIVTFAR